MYTILGATGHVGSAVAGELLAAGEQVTVVVRSAAKGEPWARRGAGVAVADLGERTGLAAALRGSSGLFAMLPTDYASTNPDADHLRMADAIADAVADCGVRHVVMLSSMGAELAEGTGPIRYLHHLENRLRATGTVLSALRCCHFQEKAEALLGAARAEGVYPVFGASADTPMPMIATRDVGAIAAETLRAGPSAGGTVDLFGPAYTEREVAKQLGALLGTELGVALVPPAAWADTIAQSGASPQVAALLAELYEAGERGLLEPGAARSREGRIGIAETLRGLVG